jgi:hypothetical protein
LQSIEREPEDPEGSVGESYAIEDHYELDDEEERVQQEMRKVIRLQRIDNFLCSMPHY